MSNGIMNEVMSFAYDCRYHLYYQDTDSFHISREKSPILEKAFKFMYNRDLISNDPGQFHSDPQEKDLNKNFIINIYFSFCKGRTKIYSSACGTL